MNTTFVETNVEPQAHAVEQWQALNQVFEQQGQACDCKKVIKAAQQDLLDTLINGASIYEVLLTHTAMVDAVLVHFWQQTMGQYKDKLSLIPIGGYGRSELYPGSDLDIVILGSAISVEQAESEISEFLSHLWDLGFPLGHSVQTFTSLYQLMDTELDSYTAALEGRYLAGKASHVKRMLRLVDQPKLWSSVAFFAGKKLEIKKRYEKARGTGYNLEPNIKDGSGGLRDIHMLRWIGNKLYGQGGFKTLVDEGALTADERLLIQNCEQELSKIRFALHMVANRPENRLLFEHQKNLADLLGYEATPEKLAVEVFMQHYFQNIWEVRCLIEMAVQHYEEVINPQAYGAPELINSRFQSRGNFIEARNQQVFRQDLHSIFELFLLMQKDERLIGVRSNTVRLLREAADQIDQEFIQSPRAAELFIEILSQPTRITRVIRRMHRYGILAKYIPEFLPLVGQMQFDMFHVYTVDQHTIFVVRNLRRLMDARFSHELPFVSKIMRGIEHEWLLLIAGLFHDIGKGRGGDHSKIGAEDVREFGVRLGLTAYQIELISWLVASHLMMSMTAQKKDIDDPRVIAEFADAVETKERLDHLYLLTVADIRGTNPELWNGWKEALLERLYRHTEEALRKPSVVTIQKKAAQVQAEAKHILQTKYAYNEQDITEFWQRFTDDYFCRFSPSEIAWHSAAILEKQDHDQTAVLSRFDPKRGGDEFMIYAFDKPRLFAAVATVLAKMQLNIYDARVTSSYHRLVNGVEQNYVLNSYTVLGGDDEAIVDESQLKRISDAIYDAVNDPEAIRIGGFKAVHRSIRIMDKSVRIVFDVDKNTSLTTLDLKAPDTPGLMAMVGLALTKHQVQIHNARISTLGDKARDIFWLSDEDNNPLTEETQKLLHQQIIEELSELYGWDVSAEDNELQITDTKTNTNI